MILTPSTHAPTHAINVADPWAWALTYKLTHAWRTSVAPPERMMGSYLAIRVLAAPATERARREVKRMMGIEKVPDHLSHRPGQVLAIARLAGWGLFRSHRSRTIFEISAHERDWDAQYAASRSSPWARAAAGAGQFVWFFDFPRWVPSGFRLPGADEHPGAWPLPQEMLAELARVGQHATSGERAREAKVRALSLPSEEHVPFRWNDNDPPGMESCVKCGLVRPLRSGFSKPCRGWARISLRSEDNHEAPARTDT